MKRALPPMALTLGFALLVARSSAEVTVPDVRPKVPIFNPKAPAQGTITIGLPSAGATWFTGGTERLEWSTNGTRSNIVTVTLWKDGQQAAVVKDEATTGRTAHTIPLAFPTGEYELRVTSYSDARVEARVPLRIERATITVPPPADQSGTLRYVAGRKYTITWSTKGNPGPVDVVATIGGKPFTIARAVATDPDGKGSVPWEPSIASVTIQLPASLSRFESMHSTLKVSSVALPEVAGVSPKLIVSYPSFYRVGNLDSSRNVLPDGTSVAPGTVQRIGLEYDSEATGWPIVGRVECGGALVSSFSSIITTLGPPWRVPAAAEGKYCAITVEGRFPRQMPIRSAPFKVEKPKP